MSPEILTVSDVATAEPAGEPVVAEQDAQPTADPTPVSEPAKTPQQEREASRFAAIARREKAAVEAQLALKREREAMAAERAERDAYLAEKRLLETDPLEFLAKYGKTDFETLARRHVLKEPAAPPAPVDPSVVSKLEAELKELKAWREQTAAERDAATKASTEASGRRVIEEHLQERLSYAKAHAEDFELTLENQDDASRIYLDLYRRSSEIAGRDLDDDEVLAVMARTEKLLTDREEARIVKLRNTKRFASRFATEAAPREPQQTGRPQQDPAPIVRSPGRLPRTQQEIEAEALDRVGRKFPRGTPIRFDE